MPDKPFAKSDVAYTDHGRLEHCSICAHYVNATTCAIVRGEIKPGGWCNKFTRREGRDWKR